MIKQIKNLIPEIHKDVFIAENAQVIGKVKIGKGSSVWYSAVVRGDRDEIIIGENTNIQHGCIIHNDAGTPTYIGDNVTVGHGAILHACKIADNVQIGMGAIVLDLAEVGEGAIVAAGAVVAPRAKIEPFSLVVGTPAKALKKLPEENLENIKATADVYNQLWNEYYK